MERISAPGKAGMLVNHYGVRSYSHSDRRAHLLHDVANQGQRIWEFVLRCAGSLDPSGGNAVFQAVTVSTKPVRKTGKSASHEVTLGTPSPQEEDARGEGAGDHRPTSCTPKREQGSTLARCRLRALLDVEQRGHGSPDDRHVSFTATLILATFACPGIRSC